MIQKIFANLTISFKIQNKVQKDIIIDKNVLEDLIKRDKSIRKTIFFSAKIGTKILFLIKILI